MTPSEAQSLNSGKLYRMEILEDEESYMLGLRLPRRRTTPDSILNYIKHRDVIFFIEAWIDPEEGTWAKVINKDSVVWLYLGAVTLVEAP